MGFGLRSHRGVFGWFVLGAGMLVGVADCGVGVDMAVAGAPAGGAAQDGSAAEALPVCLEAAEGASIEATVLSRKPERREMLARLAYAEGKSTGFPDEAGVYQGIAWGVMNRVRLGERSASLGRAYGEGVAGVVFKKGQFNPAVSKRSRFSRDFLCPDHLARWGLAVEAAARALEGKDNPFILTGWEKAQGLSLVVNFYYPRSIQAKGPLAPWEGNPGLEFIGDVRLGSVVLSADRVRFYRLKHAPRDLKPGARRAE